MNKDLRDKLTESLKSYSELEWSEEELDHFISKALYDIVKETQEEILIDEMSELQNEATLAGALAAGLKATLVKELVKSSEFNEKNVEIEFTPQISNLANIHNEQVDVFDNKIKQLLLNKKVIKIERR